MFEKKTISAIITFASDSATVAASKDSAAKRLYNEGATDAKLRASTENNQMYEDVQKYIRTGYATKNPGLEALLAKPRNKLTATQYAKKRKLTTALSARMGDLRTAVGKLEEADEIAEARTKYLADANKWEKAGKEAGEPAPVKPDILLTPAERKAAKKAEPEAPKVEPAKAAQKVNTDLDNYAKSLETTSKNYKNIVAAITRLRNAISKQVQ